MNWRRYALPLAILAGSLLVAESVTRHAEATRYHFLQGPGGLLRGDAKTGTIVWCRPSEDSTTYRFACPP